MRYVIQGRLYASYSGGHIALHKLCHMLNEKGCEAFLSEPVPTNPEWNTPILDTLNRDTDIVIYPEDPKDLGNPLNAKNVVRWILYFLEEDVTYQPSDMIFYYLEDFFRYNKKGSSLIRIPSRDNESCDNLLYCIESQKDIFTNLNFKRYPEAVIMYKANLKGGKCKPEHRGLPNMPPFQSQEYYLQFFNHFETIYCYDNATYYSVIAAMCGCKVVMIDEPSTDGLICEHNPLLKDFDEITQNPDAIFQRLETAEQHMSDTLDSFIKLTQERFS